MITRLLPLLLLTSGTFATPPPKDTLATFKGFAEGFVAQCKQSPVDELQIVAGPRKLTKEEAVVLAAFFGKEESYERRKIKTFCSPYYDFKILLFDPERNRVLTMRLCTGCDEILFEIDYAAKQGATIDPDARKVLYRYLDGWFPGWQDVTRKNRIEWIERKR